jgi:hypothetical protein
VIQLPKGEYTEHPRRTMRPYTEKIPRAKNLKSGPPFIGFMIFLPLIAVKMATRSVR